jgi:uncharacterized protein (TIGR02118 family)
MTAKLMILYSGIKDPKKFDDYYKNVHIPLAKKIPGIKKIIISKVKGVAVGKANYYQVVEAYFDDMESLKKAAESKETKEAMKDGLALDPNMTILLAEEE